MISQDKDWQGKVDKMGPVNHFHRDGTGRFRLLKETFMDVYTGRVMSHDEAESRLTQIPKTSPAEFRPPYQFRPPYVEAHLQELESRGEKPKSYPFQRQADKGQMTSPLTGLIEPRCYVKSYGCDGGVDYGHLITMRSATPAFYDKRIESGTVNIAGPRSGCTNSVIPANGVLNMPYFYEGCTCSYPLPTGAALISMPQTFEQWTAWGPGTAKPIVRVGVNLGAPGDRMTHSGTLFLDRSPSLVPLTRQVLPSRSLLMARRPMWLMELMVCWFWMSAFQQRLSELPLTKLQVMPSMCYLLVRQFMFPMALKALWF